MKKYGSFIVAISLLVGCATARLSLDDQLLKFTNYHHVEGRVIVVDKELEKMLQIKDFRLHMEPHNTSNIQVKIANLKPNKIRFDYKIRWYFRKMTVENANENWLPTIIERNDYTVIDFSFPSGKVEKFELLLKGGRSEK